MLNQKQKIRGRRMAFFSRYRLILIAASAVMVAFSQSSCFFSKKKAAVATPTGIRLVLLPFNVSAGNKELRWIALAGPIMMAKVSENARDLEVIPLWESMPIATEAGGVSRTFTQDSAAYVASWLTAKWAAMADVSATKSGITMMIDFIPSKTTLVAFRFTKSGKIDSVGSSLPEAYNEFLRYLTTRPLERTGKSLEPMTSMKNLAEALDREYGWFVAADPGKAQQIVSDLARSDARLARLLFNPSVYPVLAQTK